MVTAVYPLILRVLHCPAEAATHRRRAARRGDGLLMLLVGLAACLAGGCRSQDAAATAEVTATRRIMGAPWTIVVHAADAAAGEAAIAAAFAEIERLEQVLSDYVPESELSRLSAAAPTAEPVQVSDDLWRVLVRAESLREASGGAFDIAVGPLTSLWRQSRRSGRLPRDDKLAAARAAVGAGTIELVPGEQAVRLPKAGTRLDPGGIGMGYAADRALEILAALGIDAAMIDASGDILVSGPPPGRDGWRVAIAPLRPGGEGEVVVLTDAAVTTSGDAYQAVEIDGTRYSHIVDPRTGIGVAGPAAVTVIAPDATTADSLATAASVLGPEAGGALVEAFPACSARFLWQDNGETRVETTSRWPAAPGGNVLR
ncbi:MAG: FAD:protein FMN transferase [Planctomycetota bacterium]|nr:FAD:protein FMN transferase [Planctomycetota bacterium]